MEDKKEDPPAHIEEPKEVKKEQSDIDDYEDNWDMSDHDLQDNSENKQAINNENENEKEKEELKNNNLFDSKMQNVVNFDEIPTNKDSKTSV